MIGFLAFLVGAGIVVYALQIISGFIMLIEEEFDTKKEFVLFLVPFYPIAKLVLERFKELD